MHRVLRGVRLRHGVDDELRRDEALDLARRVGEFYAAFGGGEPLGVPHCWELFEILAGHGVALKIETDGSHPHPLLPARDRHRHYPLGARR